MLFACCTGRTTPTAACCWKIFIRSATTSLALRRKNWGTAVHECGHAIFHLSDEYEGCACFQADGQSNVFRERAECEAWNMANGFPTASCYELTDVYARSW